MSATKTEARKKKGARGPGLYAGIPVEEYHRMEGVSQSQLKVLRDQSPAHLRYQMDHPKPSTPAQIMGAAIHNAILLPEVFAARYAMREQCKEQTASGKRCSKGGTARFDGDWRCHQHHPKGEDADEVVGLSEAEWKKVEGMQAAIGAHPLARQLLVGDAERSAVWVDEETGVVCRARYDLMGARTRTLVDLKKTQNASRGAFSRAIWNFSYHIQAAHYLEGARTLGLDFDGFAFVAVEEEPPHGVGVFELTEAAVYDGRRELRPLIEEYARCEEAGEWPGYEYDREQGRYRVSMVDLPVWAPRDIDRRLEG